jgi:hypothetical protein
VRGKSLEEWIFIIEDNSIPVNRIMSIVSPLLRGTAVHEYMSLAKLTPHRSVSWEEVKTRFRTVFNDVDEQRKVLSEMRNLIMSNMNDHNLYVQKFIGLRSKLVGIPEGVLLDNFLAGLNDKFRADVLAKKPTNVNEAIEISNWYDETLNRMTAKHSINYSGVSFNKQYKPRNPVGNNSGDNSKN